MKRVKSPGLLAFLQNLEKPHPSSGAIAVATSAGNEMANGRCEDPERAAEFIAAAEREKARAEAARAALESERSKLVEAQDALERERRRAEQAMTALEASHREIEKLHGDAEQAAPTERGSGTREGACRCSGAGT